MAIINKATKDNKMRLKNLLPMFLNEFVGVIETVFIIVGIEVGDKAVFVLRAGVTTIGGKGISKNSAAIPSCLKG